MSAPTEDAERMEWLIEQAQILLCAAIDKQSDAVARTVCGVGERYGNDGVYGICCVLAAAVHKFGFPSFPRGDGSLTGPILAIQQIPGRRGTTGRNGPDRWAASFVATYINGDMPTNSSLFYGMVDDPDQATSNVASLVGMAGDLGRIKQDQVAREDPDSTLPPWLRRDAPRRKCSGCGRWTVATGDFGGPCRMPQPGGYRCAGRFPA